jgi:predicted secreted hydrolase
MTEVRAEMDGGMVRDRKRWGVIGWGLALGLVGVALWGARSTPPTVVSARLSIGDALGGADAEGYARATRPRPFEFPADHGPHPAFRTEWWYVTGNLTTAGGREFGFQWTVFRTSLSPDSARQRALRTSRTTRAAEGSESSAAAPLPNERATRTGVDAQVGWRTNQVYMGHFAITDVAEGRHHGFERFSRGALELAGARAEPFAVWLEDWRLEAQHEGSAFPARLYGGEDGASVELDLESVKPMVLQGDSGLSQKGPGEGNASYYYSYTRLEAAGTVTVDGVRHPVTGTAWLDREWSTSALAPDQVGWDWFALQLSDGRDLMLYQMRGRDGAPDPWSSAMLVDAHGGSRSLDFDAINLEATGSWSSPTGVEYPSGWRISIADEDLALEVTPVLLEQEMDVTFRYWEGAVRVAGTSGGRPVTGVGYVELTGYGEQLRPMSVGRTAVDE